MIGSHFPGTGKNTISKTFIETIKSRLFKMTLANCPLYLH